MKVLEVPELDAHGGVARAPQRHAQFRSQPADRFVQIVAVDENDLASCKLPSGGAFPVAAAAEIPEEGDTKRGFHLGPRVHGVGVHAQIDLDAVAAGSLAHRGGVLCGRGIPNLSLGSRGRKAASGL